MLWALEYRNYVGYFHNTPCVHDGYTVTNLRYYTKVMSNEKQRSAKLGSQAF